MADARRLVESGMAPELAKEVARQIEGALGNDGPVSQAQYANHESRIAALESEVSDAIVTDQSQ
jgi:hypothetical protein